MQTTKSNRAGLFAFISFIAIFFTQLPATGDELPQHEITTGSPTAGATAGSTAGGGTNGNAGGSAGSTTGSTGAIATSGETAGSTAGSTGGDNEIDPIGISPGDPGGGGGVAIVIQPTPAESADLAAMQARSYIVFCKRENWVDPSPAATGETYKRACAARLRYLPEGVEVPVPGSPTALTFSRQLGEVVKMRASVKLTTGWTLKKFAWNPMLAGFGGQVNDCSRILCVPQGNIELDSATGRGYGYARGWAYSPEVKSVTCKATLSHRLTPGGEEREFDITLSGAALFYGGSVRIVPEPYTLVNGIFPNLYLVNAPERYQGSVTGATAEAREAFLTKAAYLLNLGFDALTLKRYDLTTGVESAEISPGLWQEPREELDFKFPNQPLGATLQTVSFRNLTPAVPANTSHDSAAEPYQTAATPASQTYFFRRSGKFVVKFDFSGTYSVIYVDPDLSLENQTETDSGSGPDAMRDEFSVLDNGFPSSEHYQIWVDSPTTVISIGPRKLYGNNNDGNNLNNVAPFFDGQPYFAGDIMQTSSRSFIDDDMRVKGRWGNHDLPAVFVQERFLIEPAFPNAVIPPPSASVNRTESQAWITRLPQTGFGGYFIDTIGETWTLPNSSNDVQWLQEFWMGTKSIDQPAGIFGGRFSLDKYLPRNGGSVIPNLGYRGAVNHAKIN